MSRCLRHLTHHLIVRKIRYMIVLIFDAAFKSFSILLFLVHTIFYLMFQRISVCFQENYEFLFRLSWIWHLKTVFFRHNSPRRINSAMGFFLSVKICPQKNCPKDLDQSRRLFADNTFVPIYTNFLLSILFTDRPLDDWYDFRLKYLKH